MQGRELPPGKVAYETPWPLGSLQKTENGERSRYRAEFSWASTKREHLLHQTFDQFISLRIRRGTCTHLTEVWNLCRRYGTWPDKKMINKVVDLHGDAP